MKYYLGKKEKVVSLGVYPELSLIEARAEQAQLKQNLARGIDIAKQKRSRAKRERQICGQVFRYAIITERVERDITADHILVSIDLHQEKYIIRVIVMI